MRKKIKKDILTDEQNDKNPYHNLQSEAYHKMKQNIIFEKREIPLASAENTKNHKSKKDIRLEINSSKKKNGIHERKGKKRKSISKTRKVTAITFLISLIFAFMFVVLIYRNTKIVRLKYDINELNKELLNLENEKEILEVQMESSNRSDMIEKYAREQLGMDYPKENKITYIKVN